MLVAVCSLKGSPGVTTLATAMAARWPAEENPILVEADPAGGDLMARFRLAETPGLVSLAAAARRNTDPALLAQHAQLLPSSLRVVVGPVGSEQAHAALAALGTGPTSALRRAADQRDVAVIVDCGRVDPDSPALPIIRIADVMLLVARPRDDELAHVALKLPAAQRWSARPCFVLVGDGYATRDVSRTLGIPVAGRIPQDAKGAAAFRGHSNVRHGPARSPLGRAAAQLAQFTYSHWHSGNHGLHHGTSLQMAAINESVPGAALQGAGAPTRNGVRP